MDQSKIISRWRQAGTSSLMTTLLALGAVAGMLLLLDLDPFAISSALTSGSITTWVKFSYMLSVLVPLLLCSCGLLFTFRAGLWNIGIEGQVICGAICSTFILRLDSLPLPPATLFATALIFSCLGGALWGLLASLLKNHGGVNEIFGGLGLNFVAQGFILWLIFGPWKRAGIASMSGTDLLAKDFWLTNPAGWRVAPLALGLALLAFLLTCIILGATRFGLQLQSSGRNAQAARLFGIMPRFTTTIAMLLCGSLAGLTGGLQVTGVYHRLIPSISSGYGYLALLVVMLANYKTLPVPFISLIFACLAAGSIQLPMVLQVDSSLSGVIQGTLVLSALIVHGIQKRRKKE